MNAERSLTDLADIPGKRKVASATLRADSEPCLEDAVYK
jgi:hypothetical protein